jgi:leucyl-tRNA synthetase
MLIMLDNNQINSFSEIESKWQNEWENSKLFEVNEDSTKEKFYLLEMFPYPSGDGLHVGHALNYIIGDVLARYKIMNGFNVLHPMGYDALGLPAENAAIKAGVHPEEYTNKAINHYIEQQKSLGITYDWSRVINTANPGYYKWDQWIFLKMFEKGLVYQKESAVNWCPECNTVLANEQVHNGKCWRHDETSVEVKHLKQWFLKITDYADELYESIDSLDGWPSKTKAMQKNWIGKSHGTEIDFEINGKKWPIFTTRPDTIFGVTFMVISAHHKELMEIVTSEHKENVKEFLKRLGSVSEKELESMEKEGVFTGAYALNPMTGEEVPVYAGNFVVADYGAGMVMAVPAHDQRDFEFAKKYDIPIKQVIKGELTEKRAFTGDGELIESDKFNGILNREAIDIITNDLIQAGRGKKVTNFKLRDWGISRQRYWGTPIPIIHCEKCGAVPVAEKDLPVKLPKDIDFGKGNPLETNQEWIQVKCPKCGGDGKRETDTMDTFVNSSWYFLRYADPKNDEEIFDKNKVKYWCPIDQYIGGSEHTCMHLIYFRFYSKFLRDIGLIDFDEPAKKLFHQGMLHGEGGIKMSKSKGNVVNPETVSKNYGIDTARWFLLSLAAPDKPRDWSDKGILGSLRLIKRFSEYFEKVKFGKDTKVTISKINSTLKEINLDIDEFRYNLAVIKIRQLFEYLETQEEISKQTAEKFLKILTPFCPHVSEELWEKIGNQKFISVAQWPMVDELMIDKNLEKIEDLIVSLRRDILKVKELAKIDKVSKVKIFISPEWKWTALIMVREALGEKPDFSLAMKTLMNDSEMKKHGKEIQPFLKTLINNYGEFSTLEKFNELLVFENANSILEKEFGKIEIISAEKSEEGKARNAFPGKPALLIE